MNLQEFINKYTGQKEVGDTPENKGECVGLVQEWINQFSFPHVWGNAVDLLSNADRNFYLVIGNAPDNFPLPGDIVVFGAPYGQYIDVQKQLAYWGHTGVVVSADVASLTVFEQNNPIGSTPRLLKHSYKGVKGWIRLKLQDNPVVTPSQPLKDPVMRDLIVEYYRAIDTKGLDPFNLKSMKIVFDTWEAVAVKNEYVKKGDYEALKAFKDDNSDYVKIKEQYNTFTLAGYKSVDDVKKAIQNERQKFIGLSHDQIEVEKKNESLALTLAADSRNNYTAMEEGIKAIDDKERLEKEKIEIAKELGVDKTNQTNVMDRIFFWKGLAEKWVDKLEKDAAAQTTSDNVKPVGSKKTSALLTILRLIPEKRKGVK